jgi:Zn-finger nucleic acid-binding protein
MTCPKCNGNLRTKEREGVEIDICEGCGGIWLDKGELEKIVAKDQQENWRLYDRGREGYDPSPAPQTEQGSIERLLKDD